jgi:hypothetical protein
VLDFANGSLFLVWRQTDFHLDGIKFETEVSDNCAISVLLCRLSETHSCKNVVELIGYYGDVCPRRENKEEIIEIVREIPTVQSCKDPVECFGEEVEYSWGGTETKG